MIKICVECEVELMCEKAGVFLVSMDSKNEPHKIYRADLYSCLCCQRKQIMDNAALPAAAGKEACCVLLNTPEAHENVYRYWLNRRERKSTIADPFAWDHKPA